MATFTDDKGRAWRVGITVADLKTLRDLKAHPEQLLDDKLRGLAELIGDEERLVGVLYALCHEQARAASVEPEEFAAGFGGAAIEAGADAFVDALASFSRGHRRAALIEVAAKMKEVQARMCEITKAKSRAMDVDQLAAEAMSLVSTKSATASPESAASIPEG